MFSWLTGDAQIEQVLWLRPLSGPAMIAIAIGIVALTAFLYRRSFGLRPPVRIALSLFRLIVLTLIVATLLEPTAVVNETNTQRLRLPVLLDVSQSMSIMDQRKREQDLLEAAGALGLLPAADQASDTVVLDAKQRQSIASATRLDLATNLVIESGGPVFQSLGERLDVSYHAFGRTTRLVSEGSTLAQADLANVGPDAPETAIVESLEAVAKTGSAAPAAIVLLSDGIDNTTSRRSESVLMELGARGIPVYTIPIGLADPDDVSIRNIVMQEVAFSGDRVPVRVQLQSKGYERRTAELAVLLNGRRISQRNVRLEGGLQFVDIDFHVDLYEKGAVRVAVVVTPFDDEVSVENNRVERGIRVVNEKINVLYIEGNARWEFRYLRAILKRDPRIRATFIASNVGPELARNSPEYIERFPDERDEAFKYDLVILGDVEASFFKEEELGLLEELIRDRGGSLLMLCGPMSSPSTYAGTPVETMLPVQFEPDGKWEKVSESVYPVLTTEGRSSMVMTLENEVEQNDLIWNRVAPLDHLPPLLGAKPGATVLATLSDTGATGQQYPLVAWQRYGTGKCLSIATDRLWRLRFKTGDKYHWRLWSQCIQFMTLSRLMGEHKRIRLETDRSIYPVASQVRLYAHVLDDNFDPIVRPRFDIVVSDVENEGIETRVSLRPDRAFPGLYEGYFTPPISGRYRVEANEDDRRDSNATEFQITDMKRELTETNMQPQYLERIAELTGGARLTMQELPKLASLIKAEPIETLERSERALWDNGWVAALLICLLGAEWITRRRHDLP
jgi:hypothetical protein